MVKKRTRNLALISLLLLITGYAIFAMMIDNTPPTITIISPKTKTYNTSTIALTYAVDEPTSWACYSLDNAKNVSLIGNTTLSSLSLGQHEVIIYTNDTSGNIGFSRVSFIIIDNTPPVIAIISPKAEIYDRSALALVFTVNEPISQMYYSLNDAKNITLTGNATLSNLLAGRHKLGIYAKDISGNIGFTKVSFTVTRIFSSLAELINFLRDDDLSDAEWTTSYTCVEFAGDFIQRAEMKGYYCFTYYALWGNELDEYTNAVESIKVVKEYSWGTETRWYDVVIGLGHAVVRTTVNGVDVIVDPQTDIILAMKDFTVLYEGEIAQD